MRARGLVIGTTLLTASAGCGGGTGDVAAGRSAGATVAAWIVAMNDRDFDGACGLLTEAAKRSLPAASCATALRDLARTYPGLQAQTLLKTTASIEPDAVTTLSASNGKTLSVKSLQSGERWLISGVKR